MFFNDGTHCPIEELDSVITTQNGPYTYRDWQDDMQTYREQKWDIKVAQYKAEYYAGVSKKTYAVLGGMANVVTGVLTLGEASVIYGAVRIGAQKIATNLAYKQAFRITNPNALAYNTIGFGDKVVTTVGHLTRVPKGVPKSWNLGYKPGQITSLPKNFNTYAGRGAFKIPSTPSLSSIKPYPFNSSSILTNPYTRWATGIGLSGLGGYYYWNKTNK